MQIEPARDNQVHVRAASQAISLARAGQVAEGLDLYRSSIDAMRGEGLPVYLHLILLRDAGAHVAAAFQRVALSGGADISKAFAVPGIPRDEALAEYRSLFAEGVANARMLANYARILSHAGRSEELQALMDVDRLLMIRTLDDPAPDGRRLLHEALRDWFRANLDKAERLTARLAAVGTYRFANVGAFDNELFEALRPILRRHVDDYIASSAEMPAGHPMREWAPRGFDLEMFAHYSDGTGYHLPHIHSRGWITGVLYLDCDFGAQARPDEGGLHLCPGVDGDASCAGWPNRYIPVHPGMLVLMPSYFTHLTRPLGRPSHRIVLPFDVADARNLGKKCLEAA